MKKWKVDENKELPVAVIEDTPEGFGICELEGGGTASREELEKIAHLIAAAPDLLAACKRYQRMIELFRELNPDIVVTLGSALGLKQAQDEGKAAIAKAKPS